VVLQERTGSIALCGRKENDYRQSLEECCIILNTHIALREARKMRNPIQVGGVVSGPAFCNRAQDIADLLRAVENGEKLFIYSERRMGKTSLVLHALRTLPQHAYTTAYVDLWPTDSAVSFITVAAKAIAESMSSTAEQLLKTALIIMGIHLYVRCFLGINCRSV